MPKATGSDARQGRRHNPLEDDLVATGLLRNKASKRKSRHEDEGEEEKFVDSKASKKILRIGQELAAEDSDEHAVPEKNAAFDFDSRLDEEDNSGADFDEEEAWGDEDEVVEEIEVAPEDMEAFSKFFPSQEDPSLRHALQKQGWAGEGDEQEEDQGTDLAALILEKIAAHEAAQSGNGISGPDAGSAMPEDDYELPPKVVEVYTK